MIEAFHMGGWGMYPTLFFGVLMVAASARYAIHPDRRLVPLQVALGLTTFLAGSLGFVTGVIKTMTYLDTVPAEERWIWLIGVGESLNNIGLALALMIIASLASAVGALRFAKTKAAEQPATA